ncbi:protein kinase domain-containing protein [Thermogladius sp. 4427co]|uniref:protein kinase domain-containing protein n=1 Tax=Thermogladius sp. 4427co TaxID=3450718 RepID=UPI003F7A7BC6
MPIREYSDIDKVSEILSDPIQVANLLLKIRFEVANKRLTYNEAFNELSKTSKSLLKDSQAVYFTLKHDEARRVVRGVLVGEYILGLVIEDEKGLVVKGRAAFNEIATLYKETNPVVRLSYARLGIESVKNTQLEEFLKNALAKASEEKPPQLWVGRLLRDFKIVQVLSDKGGFTYVLKAIDRTGGEFVLKIPREKTADGTPLALGGFEKISEYMRTYVITMNVCYPDKSSLTRFVVENGLEAGIASELVLYKRYVSCPRGIILTLEEYDIDSYIENPPIIIETYAEYGDLQEYARNRRLDARMITSIGLRIAGALSIAQAVGVPHLDVKPQNILLGRDDKEPYSIRPFIGDFAYAERIGEGLFKPLRITPEFAEPLSLIDKKAGLDYDAYSLGLTLLTTLTNRRFPHRTLVNLLTLKYLYGLNIDTQSFLLEHPALVKTFDSLDKVYKDYVEGRLKAEELKQHVSSFIEDWDRLVIDIIRREVDKDILEILLNAISIRREQRFRNTLHLWLRLREVLKAKNWEDLIPKP